MTGTLFEQALYRLLYLKQLIRSTVVLVLLWFPASAQTTDSRSASDIQFKYSVEIQGAPDSRTQSLLREVSQLRALRERPPATRLGLNRRIRADEARFRDVMRSEGYYGARIFSVQERSGGSDNKITVTVDPGPQYSITSAVVITGEAGDDDNLGKTAASEIVQDLIGQPARAATVIAAENLLLQTYKSKGFAFAELGKRRAVVDHARASLALEFSIKSGRVFSFGQIVATGLNRVEHPFLDRLTPWSQRQIFDDTKLQDYRQRLIATGLFASIKVSPSARVPKPPESSLPVLVEVREAAQRTIGISAKYARDEGFGAKALWQHRNIFGQGEKLDLELDTSELDQTIEASISKPHFRRFRQTIGLATEFAHIDSDAFEEWSGELLAYLERPIFTTWTGRVGTAFEVAALKDDSRTATSILVGLPMSLNRDTSNDLLDPSRGARLTLSLTPYTGDFTGETLFVHGETLGSAYLSLNSEDTIILAGRAKAGFLFGESTLDLPPNKRFYTGGGGSVRGFGYQKIGPLDDNLDPDGGRSVLELGVEARIRASNTLGVVPFVDAGLVSSSRWPSFSDTMRWAAGIGGRYHTPVGPLRVDVAFPLNGRDGVDKGFQFYVSFGQAF